MTIKATRAALNMWTNVFRIGELQAISWFQFLPIEPDPNTIAEKSSKAEQKDATNYAVLSAHLQLQNEGFLSTWTNSFVGPWDPSQGVHNPDEKIKLWLFIPGRQSSVIETAQSAVSKLRVVGTGLWLAPGDSEEVAVALSQALRNTLERSMRGLSYVRFGDVFTRSYPLGQSERSLRRAQPTVEFIFSATEEAVYVHVIVSAKYIRTLCGDDIEKILIHSSHSAIDGLPVIVSPNGMLGRLTGCCPSELVKQVYVSKLKSPTGWTTGAPYVTQSPGCQMRGQSFYVEVALGCSSSPCKEGKTELIDQSPIMERTFIYPPEAVLVPMMHRAFSRFSSKRFWLQNGLVASLAESWPFWNFSGSSFVEHCLALGSTCHVESSCNSSCLRLRRRRHNTSSSNLTSSISSVSSTSSESGPATAGDGGDFDGDADSLATKQTGSNHQGNMLEMNPQAGKGTDMVQANHIADPSDTNRGILWAGLDNDGAAGLDINILLSEFGEWGGFFENDVMEFGEPPGMEAQAVLFSGTNGGDMTSVNPSSQPIEIPDQRLSPVTPTSFEGATHLQPASLIDDMRPKILPEPIKETSQIISPIASNKYVVPFSKQHNHLTKAEAMLAFAPEYAAIEFPTASENLASPFSNPYQPTSRKADSSGSSTTNSYVYNATPPPPYSDVSEEKGEASSELYTLVLSGKKESDKLSNNSKNTDVNSRKSEPPPPTLSGGTSLSTSTSLTKKKENTINSGQFLLPTKLALATDVDCIMYQAAMCRVRHTLISLKSKTPGMAASKFEIKKENINASVRIGSDMESDLIPHDGSLTSQVGVWRSVGGLKPLKPCGSSLSDESLAANAHQRQPLMDFLAALGLLVQQSASFVDVALDTNNGEGPYGWLALQEQCRRGFPCEPDAAHAGCGGLLSMCHSVDLAGVYLVDPLAADVTAPSVISLLQSDIKQAVKLAFGNSDGPLPLIDWCKGRAHLSDSGSAGDAYTFPYGGNDAHDSSSSVTLGGDSTSPPQSTGTSSTHREGTRMDGLSHRRSSQDTSNSEQEQEKGSCRLKPTLSALPTPSLLVGYQDDWLKASVNCIQLWEKAPLEPYASPKPVTYYAICPDIELLTTASVDFFQQLGTVYEICKLGTHLPQMGGGQMEISSVKSSPSGLFLAEAPQQVKNVRSHLTSVSSISDLFLSLSKGWSVKSFISSVTKVIKDLKLAPNSSLNQKESNGSPCTVVYVVCPFPEPSAVLETLVECSVALGTAVLTPSERERKSLLHSHVLRALNPSTGIDESSSNSNVIMLSGFNLPKVVLQIITVESVLRLNTPAFNELSLLKDIAFTVYNKARRVPRAVVSGLAHDPVQSASSFPGRPQMMHMSPSPMPSLWKDCLVPRMPGSAALNSREPDFDPSMRPVSWGDNSWQLMQRSVSDQSSLDDKKYLFEPLFILGEPGSVDHATAVFEANSASKSGIDEGGDSVMSHPDGLSDHSKTGSASLHCCYGWTEDWRWFVCIWTDSRGELLDSFVFPFGGVSGRQDTKVLQGLFVQVLQQGCQIIAGTVSSDNAGPARPKDVVITRLGGFFELECQEWQKAIYSIGGNEVKKWPIQLRRSSPDSSQDTAFIQERNLPSSPSPSSLYGSSMSSKSGFMKGGSTKKQLMSTAQATPVDSSRGSSALHLVQSISLVGVSVDHSLHLILQSELSQSQPGGSASYLEGFSPVKSLGSVPVSASYLLIPSPGLRYLSPTPLQLPTCLTSNSPPLAHLLHSKGMAIPLATGYVVSKPVHPVRKDLSESVREDWPSVLSVTLVDHYGGSRRGKQGRGFLGADVVSRDNDAEAHAVLETVAAELHSLSWLTVSPVFGDRRSALPFHCDMILRLRRLLHYADRELSRPTFKAEQV